MGSRLGFATANIYYPDNLVTIGYGVYETRVEYKGQEYKAIANYGCRPSISKTNNPVLEVHILDFEEIIYYEKIRVSFVRKIRDEKKFSSIDELRAQIEQDIKQID